MATLDRRGVCVRLSLGALGFALPAWAPLAARRRRQTDLVVDAIRWSDDYGGSWHTDPVSVGSDVWFEATVRNASSAAIPNSTTISVEFCVNGLVVASSNAHDGILAAPALIHLRASGGEYWIPASSGICTVTASVTTIGSESNQNDGSLSTILEIGTNNVVANDVVASTHLDTPINIPVLADDSVLPGQERVITLVQSPTDQGGTAVIAADGKSVDYTPPIGFVGQDGFTYEIATA